jgi:hypothetical protein
MFKIPEKITTEYILSKVSQEEIFERYGVPVVSHKFAPPEFIRTPYNKTCSFFYKDGRLVLQDFAYKTFNCFDLVREKYKCSYFEALLIIANDFGLQTTNIERKPLVKEYSIETKEKVSYQICKKNFTESELEFWNLSDWKATQNVLNQYEIYSISDLFINNNHFKGNLKDTFAYRLTQSDFQIYFPKSEDRAKRFRSSISIGIFGKKYLRKEPIIICKSYKDFFYTRISGFNSVCVIRENYRFTQEEITYLKRFSESIYIYFDADDTGYTNASSEALKWSLKAIFNTEEKDYSDYCKKYSLEKAKEMLNNLINEIR